MMPAPTAAAPTPHPQPRRQPHPPQPGRQPAPRQPIAPPRQPPIAAPRKPPNPPPRQPPNPPKPPIRADAGSGASMITVIAVPASIANILLRMTHSLVVAVNGPDRQASHSASAELDAYQIRAAGVGGSKQ